MSANFMLSKRFRDCSQEFCGWFVYLVLARIAIVAKELVIVCFASFIKKQICISRFVGCELFLRFLCLAIE